MLHTLGEVPRKHPSTPSCTEMSSFYIRNPVDNPRSLNAKMTNVSDFVFSMLGYIYPPLSGEVAHIAKRESGIEPPRGNQIQACPSKAKEKDGLLP